MHPTKKDSSNSKPPSTPSRTRRIQPKNTPPIPSPCNVFEFECVEAMQFLDRAYKVRPLLAHWFEKGWMPLRPRWCYNIFKKLKAGESVVWRGPAADGSSRGRPTVSNAEDFLDGCRKIQEAKRRAITSDDIRELLTTINKKHLVENGSWAHGASATPSSRTIARYFSFAAETMNVKLTNGEVQAKTNNLYTTENSSMSAMCFLLVQAISGLVVGEPHSKTKPLDTATEGAQILADLDSKTNGNVSVYAEIIQHARRASALISFFWYRTVYGRRCRRQKAGAVFCSVEQLLSCTHP
jgi:hypothetical protein